jgi:hypothetical protein
MNDHKGLLGTSVTAISALTSLLPVVNLLVQIGAGIMAIVVGFYTARYYRNKYIEDRK